MKYFLLFLLFILATLVVIPIVLADSNPHHEQGEEGPPGPPGPPGIAGVAGVNAQGSVSDDKFDTGIASMIALSNIDFSSSTKAWQVGLAVGTYDGEQAMAFGAGKLITKYDMLFKTSGTIANDEYGVGVGLMWKIQ